MGDLEDQIEKATKKALGLLADELEANEEFHSAWRLKKEDVAELLRKTSEALGSQGVGRAVANVVDDRVTLRLVLEEGGKFAVTSDQEFRLHFRPELPARRIVCETEPSDLLGSEPQSFEVGGLDEATVGATVEGFILGIGRSLAEPSKLKLTW